MSIVGKVFMFQLANKKRIKIIGFTMKGVFFLIGIYTGPWIGHRVY